MVDLTRGRFGQQCQDCHMPIATSRGGWPVSVRHRSDLERSVMTTVFPESIPAACSWLI